MLAVVFRHFGVPGFSGGFVGVDVFFVISGFLITELLCREVISGDFSIARFYARRIRRIAPALTVMLAVTAAVSAILLLPDDLARFGRSLATAAFGASNFTFWREAGYFGGASTSRPLLHTWSLGVEEQFYLLYPWLLAAMVRRGRGLTLLILLMVGALSIAAAQWAMATRHADPAFYLLPFRAGELLCGGVLSLAPQTRSRFVSSAGVVGLLLILLSIAVYSERTPFPGLAALVPCVGATLVIWARGSGPAGWLLSRRAPVVIGKMSYSLYLWHWPILVLAGYYALGGLGWIPKAALIAASLGIAALSWRFVEAPARRFPPILWRMVLAFAPALIVLAGLGLILSESHGFAGRFKPGILERLPSAIAPCPDGSMPDKVGVQCRLGGQGEPDFVVWGDSHAMALAPAFDQASLSNGRTGQLVAANGCPPLLNIEWRDRDCRAADSRAMQAALKPRVRLVFLVARWALYAEGSRYGAEPGGAVSLQSDGWGGHGGNHAVYEAGLSEAIDRLRRAGKRVAFVNSVPEVSESAPQVLAKIRLLGAAYDPSPSLADYLGRQSFVMDTARTLAARGGMDLLYPHQVYCSASRCRIELSGRSLYLDNNHLSPWGASLAVPMIANEMSSRSGD
ncbi:MAG: acyltransferase [Caulobacteraceae bacterium]|nr:acyltransferase [Caulobacteraceae bacterium]